MSPKASTILRWIVAVPLGFSALFILIFVPNAHVTMCMISAIGYSIGLPINRWEEKIARVTSFFSGGILFYTVYAGTTLILL